MTDSPRPLPAGRYWLVLLLDISAVTVLLALALTLPAGPWWWILAALWTAVACRRARNEHQSRHTREHP
jgi:1,4-dihydroxy-2-naphthoate octaprenyltransferase